MNLMADVGVDKPIIDALRKAGFDVVLFWKPIRELMMIIF